MQSKADVGVTMPATTPVSCAVLYPPPLLLPMPSPGLISPSDSGSCCCCVPMFLLLLLLVLLLLVLLLL
jgi:hypothetical protein